MSAKITPRPYRDLPRPARFAADATTAHLNALLLPLIAPVREQPVHNIVQAIMHDPTMGPLFEDAIRREGGPHGLLFTVYETLFQFGPHQIYELVPELVQSLMHTDFSADNPVPSLYCRLPGPDPIFIHVPRPPAELAVASPVDQLPLCGYYLREVTMPEMRLIEVIAVSQPPDGEHSPHADNFLFSDIPIVDEQRGLHETYVDADQYSRLSTGRPDAPHLREQMKPHIEFLTKVLCYLGMREVRREVHAERSEALAGIEHLGQKKRDAAVARARKLYDYVLISPPTNDDEPAQGDAARSVAAHHRRGHFRLAHVGQGRLERRLVWVRPTVVGLPSPAARPTRYRVS